VNTAALIGYEGWLLMPLSLVVLCAFAIAPEVFKFLLADTIWAFFVFSILVATLLFSFISGLSSIQVSSLWPEYYCLASSSKASKLAYDISALT